MSQKVNANVVSERSARFESATEKIREYFPDDFDPDKELEEAREEKYGCECALWDA